MIRSMQFESLRSILVMPTWIRFVTACDDDGNGIVTNVYVRNILRNHCSWLVRVKRNPY